MAVYRCNHCGTVAEDHAAIPASKVACDKCGKPVAYFETTFYVRKLVEKYLAVRRELDALIHIVEDPEPETTSALSAAPVTPDLEYLRVEMQNTNVLATAAQHEPLLKWFSSRQIKAHFEYEMVDTTGFFDEAAKAIGDHYDLLAGPLDQVRYAYRKNFSWVNLDLGKQPIHEAKIINDSLRALYSQTLFARYSYQKHRANVGLAIQPAPTVRRFFDGGWLEWYVFIQILSHFVDGGRAFSCARGARVEFPDDAPRELDVAFLVDNRLPIFIECKSGEFRGEIDKYARFKRRLGVDKGQFILCSPDLSDEQAAGLTAMYELTFVNLGMLEAHVASLC